MGHGELRTAAPVEEQLLRAPCEVGLSRTLVDVLESVVLAQSATDSYVSFSLAELHHFPGFHHREGLR